MKKILLIPIITTPLLTGCGNKNIITINEWFDNLSEYAEGRYSVIENDLFISEGYDFEFYVAGLIKDNANDIKIKKTNVKEFDDDYLVTYRLSSKYKDFSDLRIYVYEDKIATSATAYYVDRNPVEQRVIYELPEDNAKAIFEGATKRKQDVKDQNKKDYDEAREKASINNFFKQVDESETKPTIIRNKYFGVVDDKEDWRSYPLNYSIMDDIKELEYEELEENYRFNSGQTASIVCSIGNDLILRLFNRADGCIADIEYHFKFTYYPYYSDSHEFDVEHIGYSISNEKMQVLMDKTQPDR